ncbi:hypothetical protein [Pseudomonas sp. SDO52101_S400]
MTNDQQLPSGLDADFTFRIYQPKPDEVSNSDWNNVAGVINAILALAIVFIYRREDSGEDTFLGTATTTLIPFPDPEDPAGWKVVAWATPPLFLSERSHRIFARVVVDGINHDTLHQTLTISQPLARPDILTPDVRQTIHTRPVRVSGRVPDNSTFVGVTVKLFLDLGQDPIGEVLLSSRSWSTFIDCSPGAHSITAQSFKGMASTGRTEARLFYVAPLALESVNVDFDAGGSIRFSGNGFEGAMVKLTVVSGPDVDALPEVQVESGSWAITAKDWPLGSYTLNAIQRVSNSNGGWIDSLALEVTVERGVPDPTDVKHTLDYQPTFFGGGLIDASVRLYNPDGVTKAAPDARVGSNGQWSSRAFDVWGATRNREVHIKQYLDDQESPNWIKLNVNIPPQQPSIDPVGEIGLLPKIEGGCDPGATAVLIKFSNAPTSFNATVTGTSWHFQSTEAFVEGVVYTVEAVQTVVGLESEPASRPFSVYVERPKPTIADPEDGEECDSDLTVTGDKGMKDASMQLWDARDKKPLGDPVVLSANNAWSISLRNLKVDDWFITAQQTLNGRPSEHSDIRQFKVVVLPPKFLKPLPGEKLSRTSTLSGNGRSGGRVTVWRKGIEEPVLTDVSIINGIWEGEVESEVGEAVFWAIQTVAGISSKPSPEVTCSFVPPKPVIESPTDEEPLGATGTFSGFGDSGDKVTLWRGEDELGHATVDSDRTWSIRTTLTPPEGEITLKFVASSGVFHSDPTEWTGRLGLFQPRFIKPVEGQWDSPVIVFEGVGNPGSGTLVSAFNPDEVIAENIPITEAGWRITSATPLRAGEQWFRFRQTFNSGTSISDWSQSGRCDVKPEPPGGD